MSSATSSNFNALSVAESCLASVPSLFTTKNQYPFHSIPSKPIKLVHLSSSSFSWVSLKHNSSPFRIVPLVVQTSDWAQQEEEEEEEEEEGEKENEEGSTWESQGVEGTEEPPEDAKLFVGNLPYDIDSEKLAQVIYNRETDRSRGFGFITMNNVEEAEKAVEMFHRYDLNGRLLTVNKAAARGSPPQRTRESSFRIYVGNLPWQVDDSRLEQVFSEHGKVLNARVVYDQETGRSRGFGFVTMSSETELNDAVAALDGQSLDGRSIRVNAAEERPRRGFF